jgi:hypothetical protein
MGLSLSSLLSRSSLSSCSILLFDPRREHSSVPTANLLAVARSGRQ